MNDCVEQHADSATDLAAGYARWPALHAEQLLLVADGALWQRQADGHAWRLTAGHGGVQRPAISPCGRWVAYSASCDGAAEVMLLPLPGGAPRRLSFDGLQARVCGWHPDGRVLYASQAGASFARWRLWLVDPAGGAPVLLPLNDASDGCFIDAQRLVFVRGGLQDDHVRNYRGGAMPTLWQVDVSASAEPRPWWPQRAPTSACWMPRCDGERLYFLSEERGRAALCSTALDGADWRWHAAAHDTAISAFAVHAAEAVVTAGGELLRVAPPTRPAPAQAAAPAAPQPLQLRLHGELAALAPQQLAQPLRWLEAAHPHPDGQRALLRLRGRLWLADARLAQPTELALPGGRAGACAWAADGQSVFTVCDASGEPELWHLSLDNRPAQRLTHDGRALRLGVWPSPCGRWLAHADARHQLWLLDLARGTQRCLPLGPGAGPVQTVVWLPGGDELVLCRPLHGSDRPQLARWRVADPAQPGALDPQSPLGDDRFPCHSPSVSADGAWLFFLCDREFNAPRPHPWGDRNFGVSFDQRVRCDAIALRDDALWPWDPPPGAAADDLAPRRVTAGQWRSVPLPAGNYQRVWAGADHLLVWLEEPGSAPSAGGLITLPWGAGAVAQTDERRHVLVAPATGQSHLLLRLDGAEQPLQWRRGSAAQATWQPLLGNAWWLTVQPPQEWAQHLVDAHRHVGERMYDRGTHGVDWTDSLRRHALQLRRATARDEVDAVLGQMLAELGTLHTFVRSMPPGVTAAGPAFLGIDVRPEAAGLRVQRVLRGDPARPELLPPGASLCTGELILAAAGRPAAGCATLGQLLHGLAGQRVRLDVLDGHGQVRQLAVQPVTAEAEQALRLTDAQWQRRAHVLALGGGRIGYVQLQAMRRPDLEAFARDAWALPQQQGLIVDVRGNRGGNVDSWLIEKLRREAWAWWSRPDAPAEPNMPGSLRVHLAVLIDSQTYSDGETFAAAVRHFGLGPLIGQRSSGAGVWLAGLPNLLDGGSVTVGEFGQFDAQGRWLIEGQGVAPDLAVDNALRVTDGSGDHAPDAGADAQLLAAVQWLEARIAQQPWSVPQPPAAPRPWRAGGLVPSLEA